MKKVKILLALFALTGAILFSSETKSQGRYESVHGTIHIENDVTIVDCTEPGSVLCIVKKCEII
ncbi:hypothetical protein [Thermonema rossianum]|uniref:hypothetical protein n=1 Tax=Thermonema rossianum TaxID=55505 RepID=UPI0012F87F45|nr:hypothetical protein [Thermonema rossianum]